jgi:GDP-L-fucose synthase
MINKKSSILLTGHKGLVGSAILRRLIFSGYKKIITIDKKKLDLRDQKEVFKFFRIKKIDGVINAAALVGGILANSKYKANFIYDNITIQNNIIHACYMNNIKDLIFLGSSCIYPKMSKQPIKESYLLTGELEKTNEPYAIAKIAGIKMCESYNFQYKTNFKCLMPCNLYGPNDNYDLNNSHFFPALIKKMHKAKKKKNKKIVVWGTGNPKRELMHVDDLADACIFFFKKKTKESLINIGTGKEKKIIQYVDFLKKK